MAIRSLPLPSYVEPAPRMAVATRYLGPALAATRRFGGYRLMVETDRYGDTNAWLERTIPKRK